jgi:hypothetical protein
MLIKVYKTVGDAMEGTRQKVRDLTTDGERAYVAGEAVGTVTEAQGYAVLYLPSGMLWMRSKDVPQVLRKQTRYPGWNAGH